MTLTEINWTFLYSNVKLYGLAKISAQLNNELACNGTIIIWQHVVTQTELILFVENIYCFISVIGSAITTTILKRLVFLM